MPMQQITQSFVQTHLPARPPNAHKGIFGKALCVCGSEPYRGAAALSCLGALRIGAGLVTLAAPEIVLTSVSSRILEATFLPLPDADNLITAAQKATAVLIGCGLPETAATKAQTAQLLPHCQKVVLDAGGLCSLGGSLWQTQLPPQSVLTPHLGEMARLWDVDITAVQANPEHYAKKTAQRTNAVTVLKSHRTLVAAPDGTLWQNTTGNAGLARGGSGDVLAGMIVGLLAQGVLAEEAAVCGVWLHGAAADLCAKTHSMRAMLPGDLPAALCSLLAPWENTASRKEETI